VRDRYDGSKRNPWNEIECGSNYARSMASWGAMIVLSGFTFDATRAHIGFAPRVQQAGTFRSFWSGANAYGTVELAEGRALLRVLGGDLELEDFGLPVEGGSLAATLNGKSVAAVSRIGGVGFASLAMTAGDVLDLEMPTLSLRSLPDLATL
jgi:non-lysosomal glucosylceramidase